LEFFIFTAHFLWLHGVGEPRAGLLCSKVQAVLENRPSAQIRHPFVVTLREKLISDGTLLREGDHWRFTQDAEFTSPSTAAAVVHGGGANGQLNWKSREGRTLKEIENA
jgi:hypothetical protein